MTVEKGERESKVKKKLKSENFFSFPLTFDRTA